jgi:hypothetical protein
MGQAVGEGFRLPWNTTRTLADVWADEVVEQRIKRRQWREQSYRKVARAEARSHDTRQRYAGWERGDAP